MTTLIASIAVGSSVTAQRARGTKSSLLLPKPLFLKISFYLNRAATCVPFSAFLAISSNTSNDVYLFLFLMTTFGK